MALIDRMFKGHKDRVGPKEKGWYGETQVKNQRWENPAIKVRGGLGEMPPAIDAHIKFKRNDGQAQDDSQYDLDKAMQTEVFLPLNRENAKAENRDNECHCDN